MTTDVYDIYRTAEAGRSTAVSLSAQQAQAVQAVRAWFRQPPASRPPFFYLAGFAGVGKTTLIPEAIAACGLDPAQVAFCAPTGKAALVMSRKLHAAGIDAEAITIHRTIYLPPEQRERGWEVDLTFHRDPDAWIGTTACRLAVVDEASMVGERLARDLLSFRTPVLAIGDPAQLPPVEDTPLFTAGAPDVFLTEIHRQAADNPIIALSAAIRQGRAPDFGCHGDGAVRVVRPGAIDVPTDPAVLPQVICGTHKRRWALTALMREVLGFTGPLPQAGERLLVCRNSRSLIGVINGVQATATTDVRWAEDDAYAVLVDAVDDGGLPLGERDFTGLPMPVRAYRGLFDEHDVRARGAVHGDRGIARFKAMDLEHIDWGWAITAHKSQGSSWPEVLVWDEAHVFREDWKRWLYTAVTRAEERLIIVTR